MSAIFSFPKNESSYTQVNIYKSNPVDDTYSLVDTVDVDQKEYEDETGDYSNNYKVSFTDGENETSQISVQTLVQHVIDILRIEFKIDEDELSSNDIDFIVNSIKSDVAADLSTQKLGEKLEKMDEGVYKIPNRFYFDLNFGGEVSPSDIELYKQEIPLVAGTERVPVQAIKIEPYERFVIVPPLTSSEILKIDYHTTGRKLKPAIVRKTMAFKICADHYDALYSKVMDGSADKVKVGDVSINTSAAKKANVLKDMSNKMHLKYKQHVQQLTRGFVKVK